MCVCVCVASIGQGPGTLGHTHAYTHTHAGEHNGALLACLLLSELLSIETTISPGISMREGGGGGEWRDANADG